MNIIPYNPVSPIHNNGLKISLREYIKLCYGVKKWEITGKLTFRRDGTKLEGEGEDVTLALTINYHYFEYEGTFDNPVFSNNQTASGIIGEKLPSPYKQWSEVEDPLLMYENDGLVVQDTYPYGADPDYSVDKHFPMFINWGVWNGVDKQPGGSDYPRGTVTMTEKYTFDYSGDSTDEDGPAINFPMTFSLPVGGCVWPDDITYEEENSGYFTCGDIAGSFKNLGTVINPDTELVIRIGDPYANMYAFPSIFGAFAIPGEHWDFQAYLSSCEGYEDALQASKLVFRPLVDIEDASLEFFENVKVAELEAYGVAYDITAKIPSMAYTVANDYGSVTCLWNLSDSTILLKAVEYWPNP